MATVRISSASSSRRAAVSSLESARPSMGQSPGSTTAAATSGPARAPRPASSQPATRVNPAALRRSSNTAVASTSGSLPLPVQPAEPVEGPEPDEGPSDDVGLLDEPPGPGVGGVGPVVSHDEQGVPRHGDLRPALVGTGARRQVRLGQEPAVAQHPAPGITPDPVAGQADHAFDEVTLGRRDQPDGLPQPADGPADRVALDGLLDALV